MSVSTFPCSQCGAELNFEPGTSSLKCRHCGCMNEIAAATGAEELDFQTHLANLEAAEEHVEALTVKCSGCGAETTLPKNVTSSNCAFCGVAVVATGRSARVVKPKSLLPFKITRENAADAFTKWLSSRWFAPSDLKRVAALDEAIKGVYVPYWTYDCRATTAYTGQRGEHYYETQWTTSIVNGKSVRQQQQVRKTRWYPASGTVLDDFNDILVPATQSLSVEELNALEPWDLKLLVGYDDRFLSGFRAEAYAIDLKQGFGVAQVRMEPFIETTIRRDIGGDVQNITSKRSSYSRVTFKHILLPVWMSAYRYRGKVYHILINARTGELIGARPYSVWKITLAVLAALLVIGIIVLIAATR
jgi:DNA-directed RNA polymerase subunit RPC12/RpoP